MYPSLLNLRDITSQERGEGQLADIQGGVEEALNGKIRDFCDHQQLLGSNR